MSNETPISLHVAESVTPDVLHEFLERSGHCMSDGSTIEQADRAAYRLTFGVEWEGKLT